MIDWESVTGETEMDKQVSVMARMVTSAEKRNTQVDLIVMAGQASIRGVGRGEQVRVFVWRPEDTTTHMDMSEAKVIGSLDYTAGTFYTFQNEVCVVHDGNGKVSQVEDCGVKAVPPEAEDKASAHTYFPPRGRSTIVFLPHGVYVKGLSAVAPEPLPEVSKDTKAAYDSWARNTPGASPTPVLLRRKEVNYAGQL